MSITNSSDIIGNRTRDLPACSEVSQPTAPPDAPTVGKKLCKNGSRPDRKHSKSDKKKIVKLQIKWAEK